MSTAQYRNYSKSPYPLQFYFHSIPAISDFIPKKLLLFSIIFCLNFSRQSCSTHNSNTYLPYNGFIELVAHYVVHIIPENLDAMLN